MLALSGIDILRLIMKANTKRLLIIWLVVMPSILLAIVGTFFYFNYFSYGEGKVPVTRKVYKGFSGKARSNPLLAFERFLEEMGYETVKVDRLSRFDVLPQYDDTIILNASPSLLGNDRVESVLRWVYYGGHLIYSASSGHYYDDSGSIVDDAILERLDTKLKIREYKNGCYVDNSSRCVEKFREDKDEDNIAGEVYAFQNSTTPLKVRFSAKYSLESDKYAKEEISDNTGVYMLQYKMGQGVVTILSDAYFLRNDQIIENDHASFINKLIGDHGSSRYGKRSVWIHYSAGMPNVIELIWMRGWMVVISIVVLVICFLLYKGRRFGPILSYESTSRRSLLEHVNAVSLFLWKKGGVNELLSGVRQKVNELAEKNHPLYTSMKDKDKYQFLAEITGFPEEKISYAMTADLENKDKKDIRVFTEIISLLNKINRKLL